jgi:hypothetical protein
VLLTAQGTDFNQVYPDRAQKAQHSSDIVTKNQPGRGSTLALLVARICVTDHPYHTIAANYLAVPANFLH